MPKLIAIVDDEPEMEFLYSMLFGEFIEKGVLKLEFFSDSRDLLPWMKGHHPDLILSDINMPHLSGPELAKSISATGCDVPTIFVSGHEESEYREQMKELGIGIFLSKPLDFDYMLNIISSELNLPPLNN